MTKTIDLNCDMGELLPGKMTNFDEAIMPFISSCNICCGFHSGNPALIEKTIRAAITQGVSIGAHPSYDDRENFGRKSLSVDLDVLLSQIRYQVAAIKGMVESLGAKLQHVKAHGALYNDMVKDPQLAKAFVELIKTFDPKLRILGLAESQLEPICKAKNMTFVHEVFADRKYQNKTQLRSRQYDDAVLHDPVKIQEQIGLFLQNKITDHQGQTHAIKADSICLHSDTKGAVQLAQQINHFLKSKHVDICSH